jgi:HSP20 family protein
MATLIRWEPLRELAAMQNDMSRWMNGLLEGPGQTTQSWVPAVDVWETEQELVYAFDLPGIPEDKISVEFEDGALTLSAERAREHEIADDRFYRFERRFGTFTRSIGLPQGIAQEDISADYKNGVLEVHVRKPEEKKPHRIQVGSSARATIEGSSEQKQESKV